MGMIVGAAGAVGAAAMVVSSLQQGNAKLAKMSVQVEGTNPKAPFDNTSTWYEVLFNPEKITRTRSATWDDKATANNARRALHFNEQPMITLGLELMFDTTEGAPGGDTSKAAGFKDGQTYNKPQSTRDVRDQTWVITQLTDWNAEAHHPPFCRLMWGNADLKGNNWFTGVTTKVTETFTYFAKDGTPQRCKLGCEFKGWVEQHPELHSNDIFKAYVVRRGDTLASIARDMMHDTVHWRLIAEANGITDPLCLEPGQVLEIPIVSRR